jgi:hypothetical protein
VARGLAEEDVLVAFGALRSRRPPGEAARHAQKRPDDLSMDVTVRVGPRLPPDDAGAPSVRRGKADLSRTAELGSTEDII